MATHLEGPDRTRLCLPALLLLPLVLTVVLSGCLLGRGERNSPFSGAGSGSGGPVTLEVSNQHWNDMTIYALVRGQRIRLGRVTSLGKERLELPQSAMTGAGDFQFLAVPLASRSSAVRSSRVVAHPGDRVQWTLQNNLALSFISVRP